MEPIERVCGHRYRNASGVEFICRLEDHPAKPNQHYFAKDPNADVSPQRLEAAVEDYFRKAVKRLLGSSFKLTIGGGAPDRLVLLPGGITVFVELKSSTGSLDPRQRHWHHRASLLGHHVYVLSSKAQVDEWTLEMSAAMETARLI